MGLSMENVFNIDSWLERYHPKPTITLPRIAPLPEKIITETVPGVGNDHVRQMFIDRQATVPPPPPAPPAVEWVVR